ncbi:MAG: glycerol-3-phosphate acyltransferase [Dehalococcoidia bacterium]
MSASLAIIAAYIIGSFPSAYLAGRLIKGEDIHCLGDGNAGAANAYHEIGPLTGITVGLLDAAKGGAAVLVARGLGMSDHIVLLAGVAAVAGHNWPVFFRFRGGRGEATAIGVLVALVPNAVLISLGIAALPLFLSRSVMFASPFLFISLPLIAWFFGVGSVLITYSIALACLVGFTHFLTTRKRPA